MHSTVVGLLPLSIFKKMAKFSHKNEKRNLILVVMDL